MLQVLEDQKPRSFEARPRSEGIGELRAVEIATLQVNLGKRCNQACHHCHVDAGPHRTETMAPETVECVLRLLRSHRFDTLDITGGAPELHPQFRRLAGEGVRCCNRVIDRCNLTVFFQPGHEDLPEFLAQYGVDITASLPCYLQGNVDRQRGSGVFDQSIRALQRLNQLGYGGANGRLTLNLVYNPVGPYLPPAQDRLEADYKRELRQRHGIEFNRLYTITNMPIHRFRHDLERSGRLGAYMDLLESAFNGATLDGLMCRHLISVSWQGYLHDCDFNQMLEIGLERSVPQHVRDFDPALLGARRICTGAHCFGCTAGSGSSCTGAVA